MRYIKGRIVTPDGIVNGAVAVEHGRIAGVEYSADAAGEVFDYGSNLIVPGFIDIHLHGIGPYTMFAASDMINAAKLQLQYGTTAFLPTAASMTDGEFIEFAQNTVQAQKLATGTGAAILGAHFEGPFINPAKKGGMDAKYLQPMSLEQCRRYVDTGALKYMTLSPELPGSEEVIRYLSQNGVTVSLGHTRATPEESLRAAAAGASAVCHLFNTFDRKRFNISFVRHAGIRHDRGRIRIHQNHFVALFFQSLASLGAGIIEFASLPDNDRPGTNDQNFLNIATTRHNSVPFLFWIVLSFRI